MYLIFYRLQLGLKDFMIFQIKTCLYFFINILENIDKKEIYVIYKIEVIYFIVFFSVRKYKLYILYIMYVERFVYYGGKWFFVYQNYKNC